MCNNVYMQLLIDTSDKDEVIVALLEGETILLQKAFGARYRQAEMLLVEIDKLFLSKKADLAQIDKIIVENRGDSFTALRIGVVTANALGYALGVPVVKKNEKDIRNTVKRAQKFDIVQPEYSQEPNITPKKKA